MSILVSLAAETSNFPSGDYEAFKICLCLSWIPASSSSAWTFLAKPEPFLSRRSLGREPAAARRAGFDYSRI